MFAERLKELRNKDKISQADLAEYCDVSQQAVGLWERGKTTPDYETLIKIANRFAVTVDYLLGVEEKPTYYTDPETAALAQELKDNPEYRALLDATRHLKPESVKEIMQFIKYQKAKEKGDID